jgi:undecaprenyl-diphosphatase
MLVDVLIMSIVEGFTEFLPVSSTGHLLLLSYWRNMDLEFSATLSIAIQLGAILAVVVRYPRYFKERLLCFNSKPTWAMVLATLPVLVVGFLLKDLIKTVLFQPITIFIGLIVGGGGLLVAERLNRNQSTNDTKEQIGYRQSLWIGLWQCLSLWPGMSRSAMTMIGGLFLGLNRVTASSFSFVIAVPVMVAVVGYELISEWSTLSHLELAYVGIGLMVSFLFALLSMPWFLGLVQKRGLVFFGWYRIIMGTFGVLFLLL